jgi:hypothetical protein
MLLDREDKFHIYIFFFPSFVCSNNSFHAVRNFPVDWFVLTMNASRMLTYKLNYYYILYVKHLFLTILEGYFTLLNNTDLLELIVTVSAVTSEQ